MARWTHNSALEQAASTARPWQKAHRKQSGSGGPRSVPRPPLLTAGVRSHWNGVDRVTIMAPRRLAS